MPKGYWIARVDVEDADRYPDYIETAKPAFERYGAKFLVRGGECHSLEGSNRARNVIIEFASVADALDCYNTMEYQSAVKIRQSCSQGDLLIVEGIE